jgi:hypothetical protein
LAKGLMFVIIMKGLGGRDEAEFMSRVHVLC